MVECIGSGAEIGKIVALLTVFVRPVIFTFLNGCRGGAKEYVIAHEIQMSVSTNKVLLEHIHLFMFSVWPLLCCSDS